MNVFISIIEEAYVSSKTRDKNHWIYSYLKVDPQFVEINHEGNKPIKKIELMNKKIKEDKDKNDDEDLDLKENSNKEEKEDLYEKDYDRIKKKIKSRNTLKEILNIGQKQLKRSYTFNYFKRINNNSNDNNTKNRSNKSKDDYEEEYFDNTNNVMDKKHSKDTNKSNNNNNTELTTSQKEVSDYLNKKFKKINDLMDEITNIVDEVKKSQKKNFIKDFYSIVNENLLLLNNRFRELSNFWTYGVTNE